MWVDYLLAVLVGCIGLLGLYDLTSDIISLNTQAHEMTLAFMILSETVALSRLAMIDGRPPSEWCLGLPDALRSSHCSVLNAWLDALTQSQLLMTPEGRVALQWVSSAGDHLEYMRPLWTP